MPPIIGYRQVWSGDGNTLIQVFSELDTDSIELITVHRRADQESPWESLTEVEKAD